MSWKSFFGKKEEKKKRHKQRADDLGITDKELEDIRRKFNQLGKVKNGRLSSEDLRRVMRGMGLPVTEEELQQVVSEAGGAFEFEECLPLVVGKVKAKEKEMRDAFRAFDLNGDGVISISELRQAMAKMGQKLSDAEIEATIRDLDKDGDGYVNYEEFTKFVVGKQ